MRDYRCSEDPDVKGTETKANDLSKVQEICCSEDPDVKGTETQFVKNVARQRKELQRGSRCKGN